MTIPMDLVTCEVERTHFVISLNPSLAEKSWGEVEGASTRVIAEIESRDRPACIMDLSSLTYMGSSMVALVVKIWKAVRAKEGRMVVVCKHAFVLEVLQLAALDKIWTIVPDRQAAFKQLKLRDSSTQIPIPGQEKGAGTGSPAPIAAGFISSPGQRPQGWGWLITATFLLVGATILLLLGPRLAMASQFKLAGLFGLAGLALVCSLVALIFRQGPQRIVAVLVALASVGVSVGGVLRPQFSADPAEVKQPADAPPQAPVETEPPILYSPGAEIHAPPSTTPQVPYSPGGEIESSTPATPQPPVTSSPESPEKAPASFDEQKPQEGSASPESVPSN